MEVSLVLSFAPYYNSYVMVCITQQQAGGREMKKDYVIMSDNMGDLPQSYYEEHQIPIMYLSYTMDGETFDETHRQSNEAFYRVFDTCTII